MKKLSQLLIVSLVSILSPCTTQLSANFAFNGAGNDVIANSAILRLPISTFQTNNTPPTTLGNIPRSNNFGITPHPTPSVIFTVHETGITRQHARLKPDGSVEIVEQVCSHQRISHAQILTVWKDIRVLHTMNRDHPKAQEHLNAIDAHDLQTIRQSIESWPKHLSHYFEKCCGAILDNDTHINDNNNYLNLVFGGFTFKPLALYWMAENNIPPSKVLHAIAQGELCNHRLWWHQQRASIPCNTRALFHPRKKLVVNVGQNHDILECSTDPAEAQNFFESGLRKQAARKAEKTRIAEEEKPKQENNSEDNEATDETKSLQENPKAENLGSSGGPDGPEDPNKRIKIDERNAKHIFRKSSGHFSDDTPQNRQLLENLVNDKKNYLGPDQHGKDIYGKNLPDRTQLWGEVRNGKLVNGGINPEPKSYNPITGLCRLEKPPQK